MKSVFNKLVSWDLSILKTFESDSFVYTKTLHKKDFEIYMKKI